MLSAYIHFFGKSYLRQLSEFLTTLAAVGWGEPGLAYLIHHKYARYAENEAEEPEHQPLRRIPIYDIFKEAED